MEHAMPSRVWRLRVNANPRPSGLGLSARRSVSGRRAFTFRSPWQGCDAITSPGGASSPRRGVTVGNGCNRGAELRGLNRLCHGSSVGVFVVMGALYSRSQLLNAAPEGAGEPPVGARAPNSPGFVFKGLRATVTDADGNTSELTTQAVPVPESAFVSTLVAGALARAAFNRRPRRDRMIRDRSVGPDSEAGGPASPSMTPATHSRRSLSTDFRLG